jgi:hypothetical protein
MPDNFDPAIQGNGMVVLSITLALAHKMLDWKGMRLS